MTSEFHAPGSPVWADSDGAERKKLPSSFALPQVDDAAEGRRLGIRGDKFLAQLVRMSQPDDDTETAYFDVPSREPVEVGEQVSVEISFAGDYEPIVVIGRVADVLSRGLEVAPIVVLSVVSEDRERLQRALRFARRGTGSHLRRHARMPAQIQVVWSWGLAAHEGYAVNVSRSGALVRCDHVPVVGARITIEMGEGPSDALRFDALVVRAVTTGRERSFAVRFQGSEDQGVAAQLSSMASRSLAPVACGESEPGSPVVLKRAKRADVSTLDD